MPSTKPSKRRKSTTKTYTKVDNNRLEVVTRNVQIDCTSPLSVVISYTKLLEELEMSGHAGKIPTSLTRKDLFKLLNTGKDCIKEMKEIIRQRRPVSHAHGIARSICVAALLTLGGYLASDIPVKATDEGGDDPAPYAV